MVSDFVWFCPLINPNKRTTPATFNKNFVLTSVTSKIIVRSAALQSWKVGRESQTHWSTPYHELLVNLGWRRSEKSKNYFWLNVTGLVRKKHTWTPVIDWKQQVFG